MKRTRDIGVLPRSFRHNDRISTAGVRVVERIRTPTRRRSSLAAHGAVWIAVSWLTVAVAGPGLTRAASADEMLAITFSLIGLASVSMATLESRRRPYSLALAHWIFCFIFFFVAPLAQYGRGTFPWAHISVTDLSLILTINEYILIWIAIWVVVTLPGSGHRRVAQGAAGWSLSPAPAVLRFWILILASFVVLALQVRAHGVSGLLARGAADNGVDSSFTLVVNTFGRALPVALWLLAMSVQRARPSFTARTLVWGAAFLMILNNFPTMTPRYWTAALAIGIAAYFGLLTKKWTFPACMLVGIIVVFPLLGASRHATTLSDVYRTAGEAAGIRQAFQEGDYDAYAMLGHAIQYSSSFGNTSGHQLLTSALFFVPRTVWSGKSVGTGSLIAHQFGFPITNVSCPLPAEGLMNFGIEGLALFALASAWLSRRLDTDFWTGEMRSFSLVYPFLPGLFFFMMRGDLLSSTAYSVGFVCATLLGFAGRWQHVIWGTAITEADPSAVPQRAEDAHIRRTSQPRCIPAARAARVPTDP